MKKAALYLGILTISIFFCSCNAERENSVYTGPDQETVYPFAKLSKLTERVFVDQDTLTTDTYFTYDHNGLLVETDNGSVTNEISYSGTKKIVSIASTDGYGLTTNQFNYSGDKLLNVIGTGAMSNKVIYGYLSNGKVSSKDYFNLENNAFVKKRSVHYTYSADNVTAEDETTYTTTDTLNFHNTFTFDTKANPLSFLNQYLKLFSGFEELAPWNVDNKLTSSSIDADNPMAEPVAYTYTVSSNSDNAVTSIKMINEEGVTVKEWLFEYVTTPAQ